ncbi:hypothetical protein [Paraburkholderia sediminicola]|uniref:hypothetical protein n=1 Tax=Paraburkholderia sediminicola TaxID=458836 RepID=UPI0038B6B4DD
MRKLPKTRWQKIAGAIPAFVAALAVVAAVQYAITRPNAHTATAVRWEAGPGEIVVARPLAAGALLSIDGADHEGLDVYFDKARLDAGTKQALSAFKLDAPAVEEALTWRSTSPERNGHTTIDIALASAQTGAEIDFSSRDERSNAILVLTAHHATLRVRLLVLLGDVAASTVPEQKSLEWGESQHVALPGAFPITVEVPDGASVQLVFPSHKPHSRLYLGEWDDAKPPHRGLAVRDIGVKSADGGGYRIYACAADVNQISWRIVDPDGDRCSAQRHLFGDELRLAADALVVLMEGSAWFAKDGEFDRSTWYAWLGKNPVINAIGTVLTTALLGWVGTKLRGVVFGKN